MIRTIIVMAKMPSAGRVKTRLQTRLSPEDCAALADAFLRDTLAKCDGCCDRLILAYSPADEVLRASSYMSGKGEIVPQKGVGLGERMTDAFRFAFRGETDSYALMIGTDSPVFPPERFTEAFAALSDSAEVVLGPSDDGGVYLIGWRRFIPKIFDDVNWSTSTVFAEICGNSKKLGMNKPFVLTPDFDVDTPAELERLRSMDLREIAPATAAILINRVYSNSRELQTRKNTDLTDF